MPSTPDVGQTAKNAARQGGRSKPLQALARAGFAVNGVVHLLIAWIAVQLAWGGSSQDADTSGALGALASNPLGLALLWLGAVGFATLALWQVAEAVTADDAKDRVSAIGKAVVHVALAVSAVRFATGSGSNSSEQSAGATATLMSQPFGVVLVVVLGLAVVAVGVGHVVIGVRGSFLEHLSSPPRFVRLAGTYGYVAKGVALGVVGALFVVAAIRNDPEEATGLDGALKTLLEAPFGSVLLTLVAVGLAAFAVFLFGRARYGRL